MSEFKRAGEDLRKLIISGMDSPVVFHNMMTTWPSLSWTPETLRTHLGDMKMKFKIGTLQNEQNRVLFEADCEYKMATIGDFIDWRAENCGDDNPFRPYQQNIHWIYLDYKYMAEIFNDKPQILKSVCWDTFGFEGRDGKASTLWMGSAGSYTPCHYDTYGCNLVAQIFGRKRWYLFPPVDTANLYPTRIPYEESSVFSYVDVKRPDLSKYPLFKDAKPVVVTLEPGQVLYVPRHWWHYVESLETSISINTWIELESDHRERLSESVGEILINSLMTSNGCQSEEWLNPGQTTQDLLSSLKCLHDITTTLVKADALVGQKRRLQDAGDIHHSSGLKRLCSGNISILNDRNNQNRSSAVKMDLINSASSVDTNSQTLAGDVATPKDCAISLNRETNNCAIPSSDMKCICDLCETVSAISKEVCVDHLSAISFREYADKYVNAKFATSTGQSNDAEASCGSIDKLFTRFVNAVMHPDIVRQIADKMLNKS